MMVPLALMILGVLAAAMAPRLMARSDWPDREPVLALWVWQCVVAGVLLCCVLAMSLSAAATWEAVRNPVFGFAPRVVVEAYALQGYGPWAGVLALLLAAWRRLDGLHADPRGTGGTRPPSAAPRRTSAPLTTAARRGTPRGAPGRPGG